MKLTEQQLAELFKQNKTSEIKTDVNSLCASSDACDARLSDVEKIANNSHLSASYQIINQLQDWSEAIGSAIEVNNKPKYSAIVLNWLKPSLAIAAVITAVYFSIPQINNQVNIQEVSTKQNIDRSMFTGDFEQSNSARKELPSENVKPVETDTIYSSNFS
jgi:hypothetical protein